MNDKNSVPTPGEGVASSNLFDVSSLSDLDLIQNANQAHAELIAADPQSEWQASCFAALYVFAEEMGRRGLRKDSFRLLAIRSCYQCIFRDSIKTVCRQTGHRYPAEGFPEWCPLPQPNTELRDAADRKLELLLL